MHPGIFNGPESTPVSSDADGTASFKYASKTLPGFYDCTCLMRTWNWNSTITRVHKYRRERKLRNGRCRGPCNLPGSDDDRMKTTTRYADSSRSCSDCDHCLTKQNPVVSVCYACSSELQIILHDNI